MDCTVQSMHGSVLCTDNLWIACSIHACIMKNRRQRAWIWTLNHTEKLQKLLIAYKRIPAQLHACMNPLKHIIYSCCKGDTLEWLLSTEFSCCSFMVITLYVCHTQFHTPKQCTNKRIGNIDTRLISSLVYVSWSVLGSQWQAMVWQRGDADAWLASNDNSNI